MFLKLKQVSSGYPSWVKCEEDKDKYIQDYRRAGGIVLDKASVSKNVGKNFDKTKIELYVGQMGTDPKQN